MRRKSACGLVTLVFQVTRMPYVMVAFAEGL